MFHLFLVILFLFVFLTNIYWAMIYKGTERTDDDTRRQFQRNAWNVPFVGILLLFIYSMNVFTKTLYTMVTLLFLLILIMQTIYTYRKWKRKEST